MVMHTVMTFCRFLGKLLIICFLTKNTLIILILLYLYHIITTGIYFAKYKKNKFLVSLRFF